MLPALAHEIQYRTAGNCSRPRTTDTVVRLNISVHLPRIASASPGLFRTMEHGFLQQLSCPGACTHARIHLPTVTTMPASDSVLRASSCAYVRLPDHVPASMCPIFPARRSLFPRLHREMSLRWNGERPLPLISPASICSSYGGNNTIPRWSPARMPLPILLHMGYFAGRRSSRCAMLAPPSRHRV